ELLQCGTVVTIGPRRKRWGLDPPSIAPGLIAEQHYSLKASTRAFNFFKPPRSLAIALTFRITATASAPPAPVVAVTLATIRWAFFLRPLRPFILPLI